MIRHERNPAKAGIEAAESLHGDVLAGICEEFDSADEAADFDEYVGECTPSGLECGSKDRRRWQQSFCKHAGQRARELFAERTAE